MNPHPPRRRPPSSSSRAASLLAILLGVAWAASFFFAVKLSRLDAASQQQTQRDAQIDASAAERGSHHGIDAASSLDVHVVYSTDCSGYQHWQSLAAYYSLRRAGHLGRITRIASGCTKEQQEEIQKEVDKMRRQPANQKFGVHFTPSFALSGSKYKYSNKPGGLDHWMRTHSNDLEEGVVALVDPDMMALRPVLPTLGEGATKVPVERDGYRDLEEYRDAHGRTLLLRRKNLPKLPSRVTKGVAAGQHFGLGGIWATANTTKAGKDFREFNLTAVCGAASPCLNAPPVDGSDRAYTTKEFADKNYAVGPVYLASTEDWAELLPRWHAFTPRVHAQYPKLLAEMFGFTMAAADMQLKFALSSSYMVSDPKTMSTTESWMWIDEYANEGGDRHALRSVCEGATATSLPTETMRRLQKYGYGRYREGNIDPSANDVNDGDGLPTFLHYCQNYKMADHIFAKRKMTHDFFRCDGVPLKLDVDALMHELDVAANASGAAGKKQLRTGFMLCHLIPLMNLALEDYKADVC